LVTSARPTWTHNSLAQCAQDDPGLPGGIRPGPCRPGFIQGNVPDPIRTARIGGWLWWGSWERLPAAVFWRGLGDWRHWTPASTMTRTWIRHPLAEKSKRPWLPKTTRVSVVAMSYRRAAVGGRGDGVADLLASNFPGRRKFLWGHSPATMAVAVSPPAMATVVITTAVVIGLRNQRVPCGCLADGVEIGRNSRRRRDADKAQSDHCECGQDDDSHCSLP